MTWIGMKQKFKIEGGIVIRATWDNIEGWTKIYSERKQKKMM